MLLHFDDDHKKHLSFLKNLDESVIQEFCRISIECLNKGINKRICVSAAQKLQVDPELVQNAIEGLMYLFTKSVKHDLTSTDFIESLQAINLSQETSNCLSDLYISNKQDIKSVLLQLVPRHLPTYENLEWRFDIEVASRSLHKQAQPVIVFKFHFIRNKIEETVILQTDVSNLIRLTSKLEEALASLQTAQFKRMLKRLK